MGELVAFSLMSGAGPVICLARGDIWENRLLGLFSTCSPQTAVSCFGERIVTAMSLIALMFNAHVAIQRQLESGYLRTAVALISTIADPLLLWQLDLDRWTTCRFAVCCEAVMCGHEERIATCLVKVTREHHRKIAHQMSAATMLSYWKTYHILQLR